MLLEEIRRVLIHIRWKLQAYTLLGFLFACLVINVEPSIELLISFISWLLLCGGVTVFNSYYDKDEKPVAGLEHPPEAKISMLYGSLIMKFIGFILALFVNILFVLFYVLIVLFSILYSHSSFRMKSNGFVAVLFNFIMGAATFFAISSLAEQSVLLVTLGGFASGFFLASIYLMTQIHQTKEDNDRGDFSIASKFGKKITLTISAIFLTIASILVISCFYLIGFEKILILIVGLFFIIILISITMWILKLDEKIDDYRIMSYITEYSCYVANISLAIFYFLRIGKIL